MKKLMFFVALLSLIAISAFAGGVGVGNGKRVYRSPEGFTVEYPEVLSLAVESSDAFRISNEKLVRASEKLSSVRFAVTRGRVATLDELAALVARENPGVAFAAASYPGARGFYSERREGETLHGRYYLLTSNLDLVDVTVEAYPDADGLALVAPIVGTFTYDLTPPTMTELRVPNRVWPAGSKQKIWFRATDDNSGVSVTGERFVQLAQFDESGKLKNMPHMALQMAKVRAEGGDLYSLEFPVSRWLPAGEYTIGWVMLIDKASNAGGISIDHGGDRTYRQRNGGPDLPVVRVRVTNAGPVDVKGPVFGGFRPAGGAWRTGEANRLYFRLHDDVSGVDVARLSCSGLTSFFKPDEHSRISSGTCDDPRAEGNGWYSLQIRLNRYAPAGDYYLETLYVYDRAGNELTLSSNYPFDENYRQDDGDDGVPAPKTPLWRVRVTNEGGEDRASPELLEVRVDETVWRAGGTYRFRFRSHDDLSGVKLGKHGEGGFFEPVVRSQETRAIYLDQDIVADGDDWFHIDVPVGPYMQGGDYFLYVFDFQDAAGNETDLTCGNDGTPKTCVNSNGPAFAPIRVTVVR